MANLSDSLGPIDSLDVRLPESGVVYHVARPTDIDRLLDVIADDPEENLPHWATLWPSGIALADAILTGPEIVRGKRVLELGCGLGVTAVAALQAGADLTVADYAPEALDLCRHHALVNAGRAPATIQLNWRKPGAEFLALAGGGFPVVLAADVLYESRDIAPLMELVERVVAPGGLLWLAEPGRPIAREFVARLAAQGWTSRQRTHVGPWPDHEDAGVVVTLYRLRRSASFGRRRRSV